MTLNGFERTRGGWVGVSMALAMAVGCASASGVPAEGAGADLEEKAADLNQEANGNPFVFRFDSEPYGISMKEWAYHWLRRMDSIPAATNRFTSTELFFFVGDKSLAAGFDPCVTGSLQPAVADDLFMLSSR